jgi:hypothetical protein
MALGIKAKESSNQSKQYYTRETLENNEMLS